MLLLQGISASLSLSLQCSSKIWIDGWHSKQNFPPEACSTVTAMHLPLSLLAFQKLVDRIIQQPSRKEVNYGKLRKQVSKCHLCILHHWWLLFYFQYIQTHLPFRNRHNFVSRSSQSPNLLLLWSSTAKLQHTIPWRSVNGRCWSKRLKLLQLFEIQPAEMRFRGVPNSKKGEQTKSCKESWPLIYIYIYMYICMAFCGLRLVLLVGQLLLVVLLFKYQQLWYYYSTISTSTTSSSCLWGYNSMGVGTRNMELHTYLYTCIHK